MPRGTAPSGLRSADGRSPTPSRRLAGEVTRSQPRAPLRTAHANLALGLVD